MKKWISFPDHDKCSSLIIRLCFLLGLLVHTVPGLAQDPIGDYLIVDSTTLFGVDFKRGPSAQNAYFIQRITNQGIETYRPQDATLFRLDGRVYESMEIPASIDGQNWFFLEKLTVGYPQVYFLNLYEGPSRFFLKPAEGTPLVALPTDLSSFRDTLRPYVQNCLRAVENLEVINMNKSQVASLIQHYQSCSDTGIRRKRFGIEGGWLNHAYRTSFITGELAESKFKSGNSVFLGANLDIPLKGQTISINSSLLYAYMNEYFIVGQEDSQISYDVQLTYHSLGISPTFRVLKPKSGTTLFGEIGAILLMPITVESRVDRFVGGNSNEILQQNLDRDIIPEFLAGIRLGGGFFVDYPDKWSFFLKVNYDPMFSFAEQNDKLQFSGFSISAGVYY